MKSIGTEEAPPDPAGILKAVSSIGYSIQSALADLVDNSIDAGATHVVIGIERQANAVARLFVVDDGHGMDAVELHEAMRWGRADHDESDLGRYGMGLKSASFSQCNRLTVASRQRASKEASGFAGRRWTVAGVSDGWRLDVLDPAQVQQFLDERTFGPLFADDVATVVIWENLKEFRVAFDYLESRLAEVLDSLSTWLGTVFHRFLLDGRLKLSLSMMDGGIPRSVEGLDPFGHPNEGAPGFPAQFSVGMEGLPDVPMVGHVLPKSRTAAWYRLGTRGEVANLQGFYVYRNDRLVQRGGWNGLRADGEPHFSLARGRMDLAGEHDEAFALEVQKAGVEFPAAFLDQLRDARSSSGTSVRDWIRAAEETYRDKGSSAAPRSVRPARGLTRQSQSRVAQVRHEDAMTIDLVWAPANGGRLIEVDVRGRRIMLSDSIRAVANGGRRGSSGDAPLVKALAFLLLEGEFQRSSSERALANRLDAIDDVLRACLGDV